MGGTLGKTPDPEEESGSPDIEDWLGAEAHVRYMGKRPGWRGGHRGPIAICRAMGALRKSATGPRREAFSGDGPGVAGLTLLAAFVVGLLMGGGAMMLTRPRGSRDGE